SFEREDSAGIVRGQGYADRDLPFGEEVARNRAGAPDAAGEAARRVPPGTVDKISGTKKVIADLVVDHDIRVSAEIIAEVVVLDLDPHRLANVEALANLIILIA